MERSEIVLDAEVSRKVMAARLLVGLAQGLLLYWLYRAGREGYWPADTPYVMTPLTMLGLMLPAVLISGLGHLAPRRLAAWVLAAAAILIVLSLHDAWRAAGTPQSFAAPFPRPVHNAPSPLLLPFGAAFLYIAHALVMAAALEGRRIASYAAYFEIAWKLAVQLLFSLFFVAALWAVLWMGASLFELVKLTFFKELLQKDWFYVPVICFAWSCAMHVTDVRPSIVRGIRTLLLVLSSWILPVAALIVCGFLCSLPFTGLEALWGTRHATSLLLAADAVLIMLINAAFQNGEAQVALPIRVSARTAALVLLPLTAIAVYALGLRVHDYGWTTDRVSAAACLVVAGCYAAGYQWAGHRYDTWLGPVAKVNVATAFVVLAVLFALFTPIADPARLSVDNQMARLAAGRITADKLDYTFLRFEGQRYGQAALRQLAAQGNQLAATALKRTNRWEPRLRASSASLIAANVTVLPAGARLPESFVNQKWADTPAALLSCMDHEDRKCTAVLMDMDGDGKPEILLFDGSSGHLYAEQAPGAWTFQGRLTDSCPALGEKLKAGQLTVVAPRWKALEVAGMQVQFAPARGYKDCQELAK